MVEEGEWEVGREGDEGVGSIACPAGGVKDEDNLPIR